jgi:hypothetical protein
MYKYVVVLKETGEPIIHGNDKADLEKLIWDLPNGKRKWEIIENVRLCNVLRNEEV